MPRQAITIAQVDPRRVDLKQARLGEVFEPWNCFRFQEVPFWWNKRLQKLFVQLFVFVFSQQCFFLDQPKIKSKKALNMFSLVVFGRSRQGNLPAGRPCCNTCGRCRKIWKATNRKSPTVADGLRTVIHLEKVEKRVERKPKVFESCWKIGTEIYSKDALVMLRCHWIWSLWGQVWSWFDMYSSCSCFTVFATVLVIFAMFVVMSLTINSLRHDFAIWLWAKKAPNRPLSESCVLCEAAFVLLSSPKMAAFSFAFITFAILASQSASTRSREDQLMLQAYNKKDAERFLELHQFHVCSNFPRTFVGIAMGKIWKHENKGIDVFLFFSYSSTLKVNAAQRKVPPKTAKKRSRGWREDWLQIHLLVWSCRQFVLCQNNRRCDIDYRSYVSSR